MVWARIGGVWVLPEATTTLVFDASEVARVDPEQGLSLSGRGKSESLYERALEAMCLDTLREAVSKYSVSPVRQAS